MQTQKAETLARIFSDVLADLAFMFTDEEDIACESLQDPWLETTIGYEGVEASGMLRLRCTRRFTQLLSINLLGADPDVTPSETQSNDAVREFMNIVCGQLVTAIHGTSAVFDLTIPVVTPLGGPPDFDESDGVAAATVSVEQCRLQLLYTPGVTVTRP